MAMKKQDGLQRKMSARELTQELRRRILAGELRPDEPILSVRQLATAHGLSPATANLAVGQLVEEGLLYRKHGSGTFVTPRGTGVIGVAFSFPDADPESLRAGFWSWRDGALGNLARRGLQARSLTMEELRSPQQREQLEEALGGLLLSYNFSSDPLVRRQLALWRKPVIVVQHEHLQDIPAHQAIPHLATGFDAALNHLRERGCERLVLAGCDGATHRFRLNAARAAALRAGYELAQISEALSTGIAGDLGRLAGREIGAGLLKAKAGTGIVVVSDYVAFGIVDVLRKGKKKLGKELRLVSYDDLEGAGLCPFGEPLLTTLRVPRAEILRVAADWLADGIRGVDSSGTPGWRTASLPPTLIIRPSSGD